VHAPTDDKCGDAIGSFYEELDRVFKQFPKNHINMLGDFNARERKEDDIFKPTIWNESLHETNNDKGVRAVNFVTSKHLIVKGTMSRHRKIQKYMWNSADARRTIKLIAYW
jgi:hypothetical protein